MRCGIFSNGKALEQFVGESSGVLGFGGFEVLAFWRFGPESLHPKTSKTSKLQNFKTTKLQNYKTAKLQNCKTAKLQNPQPYFQAVVGQPGHG